MSFVYLASPLAHPEARTRKARFQQTVDATARLILQGHVIFSPIVHNFTLTINTELKMGFEHWRDYDLTMIDAARKLYLLSIDGWAESEGVAYELNYCCRQRYPTWFVDYDTLDITPLDVPQVLGGRLWAASALTLDDHDTAIDNED